MSGPDTHALAAFEPINLEDLTARAGLLTRVDRKYVLAAGAARTLLMALPGDALILQIDGRREFGYDSMYYDTPDLLTYHLAARKRRRRFKVRSRTYVDTAAHFIEVKTKGPRKRTVKERISTHGPMAAARLGDEASEFVRDSLGRARVGAGPVAHLRPTLRTRYRRTTLYLPTSGSRVTVDADLTWSAPGQDPVRLAGLVIVETKSGATPSLADRLLWSTGHRPVRISKFATGLAAMYPHLPATKWRPVLDRHVLPALHRRPTFAERQPCDA